MIGTRSNWDEGNLLSYRKALQLRPDQAAVHSSLLQVMNLHPNQSSETIAEERRRWHRQFGKTVSRFIFSYANAPDPDRRLRIGYVSPHFPRSHSCQERDALFLHHDRGQF